MKVTKIIIAIVVVIILGYVATKNFGTKTSAVDKKAKWYLALDKNGDGKLTREEFKAIDANGDGKLTVEEVSLYQIPAEVLKEWDKNGDGSISMEELDACGC